VRTARNYIALAEAHQHFGNAVADLPVPNAVLYELVTDRVQKTNEWFQAVIETIKAAAKRKKRQLTRPEAKDAIRYVRLRIEYGDYPAAALDAIWAYAGGSDNGWKPLVIEALKKARPETKEAAEQIVGAVIREHVEKSVGGKLPDWLDSASLVDLGYQAAKHWPESLRRLAEAPEPLDEVGVADLLEAVETDAAKANTAKAPEDTESEDTESEDTEDAEDTAESKSKTKTKAKAKPEPEPDRAQSADAARNYVGPESKGEIERLNVRVEELVTQVQLFRSGKAAADNEIERLEAEIEKLKSDAPSMSVDRHVDALVEKLKKVSREKAELVVTDLCAKLGIDPRKLDLADLKAA
jgi:hypothetical protein